MDMQAVLAYRDDQFRLDLAGVLSSCFSHHWLPGHRGIVFMPQPWLDDSRYDVVDLLHGRSVAREQIVRLPNPLWARQGLACARYPLLDAARLAAPHAALATFRWALFGEELRVIRAAAGWCQEFLAARTVEGQALASHPVVGQALAALTQDVYALGYVERAALESRGGRRSLIESVDAAAERLIKLAGGRAMLAGQMVGLRTLFLTLNRLYLED